MSKEDIVQVRRLGYFFDDVNNAGKTIKFNEPVACSQAKILRIVEGVDR